MLLFQRDPKRSERRTALHPPDERVVMKIIEAVIQDYRTPWRKKNPSRRGENLYLKVQD
jgi:hypothetical protein